MGVKRIVLIGARRVERSFWNSRVLREPALHEQLVLGLEQACDTVLPEVLLRTRFKTFVVDELPQWSRDSPKTQLVFPICLRTAPVQSPPDEDNVNV